MQSILVNLHSRLSVVFLQRGFGDIVELKLMIIIYNLITLFEAVRPIYYFLLYECCSWL